MTKDKNVICSECFKIAKLNDKFVRSDYIKYVPPSIILENVYNSYVSLKTIQCTNCENNMFDIFNKVTGFALYSNPEMDCDYCNKCYNTSVRTECKKITSAVQRFPNKKYGMDDIYAIIKCDACNKTLERILYYHIFYVNMCEHNLRPINDSASTLYPHRITLMAHPSSGMYGRTTRYNNSDRFITKMAHPSSGCNIT
jgi:hypothetical protein